MTIEVRTRGRRPRRLLAWPADIERHFDRLRSFSPWAFRHWPRLWPAEEWFPDIDIFERDDRIVIRADVPGMNAEDIEVSVEGDILTISGRREEEKEVKEEDYYCCERSSGEFSRTVRLPAGVTAEQVQAHYENGVLEVSVPRPAPAERRAEKVPIK